MLTGVIKTAVALDRETVASYWLTVFAQDYGAIPQSSFVDVYIEVEDVNDNGPEAAQPVYYFSVNENSSPDTEVGAISVSYNFVFMVQANIDLYEYLFYFLSSIHIHITT